MEVLIAGAIFLVFASGVILTVLESLGNERLAEEQIQATAYAEEGMEAVHSLKKRDFALLTNTNATGLTKGADDLWELSGNDDTFGKYTRTIGIKTVERDGSGEIVSSGSEDPKTKKVTVTVTWEYTQNRPQSVQLVGYFTEWEELF